jgi:hypothetical protein
VTARASANGHRAEPPDWSVQYQRDPSTPLFRCRCGGAWLDDEAGRAAHVAVFGHPPRQMRAPAGQPPPEAAP